MYTCPSTTVSHTGILVLVMCIMKNFHITYHDSSYSQYEYISRYSSKYIAVHINMLHHSELIKLKMVSTDTHIISYIPDRGLIYNLFL